MPGTKRRYLCLPAVAAAFVALPALKSAADTPPPNEWVSLPYMVAQPGVFAASPAAGVFAVGGQGNTPLEAVQTASGRGYLTPVVQATTVRAIAFSGDGSYLADAGSTASGSICEIWNAATGAPVWAATETQTVEAIAFSRDGKTFADKLGSSGSSAATIEVRQSSTGKLITSFTSQIGGGVNTLAVSTTGKMVATVGQNSSGAGVLELWNVATDKLTTTLHPANTTGLTSVAYSPDGTRIVAGGYSTSKTTVGRIWMWDAAHYTLQQEPDPKTADAIMELAFSADGKSLVAASNSTVEIWRPAPTGGYFRDTVAALSGLCGIGITPDSSTVLACDAGGNVESLRATNGRLLSTLKPFVPPFPDNYQPGQMSLTFSDDNSKMVVGDWYLSVYSVSNGALIAARGTPFKGTQSAAFQIDNHTLVVGGQNGNTGFLETVNSNTGAVLGQINTAATGGVWSAAVPLPHNTVADVGIDSQNNTVVEYWDGNGLHALTNPPKPYTGVALSQDSSLIAVSTTDQVQLWTTPIWYSPNLTQTAAMQNPNIASVTNLALSPYKSFVAAGDKNGHVSLWSTASKSLLTTFTAPTSGGVSLAFSQDEATLWVSTGPSILVYSTDNYGLLATYPINYGSPVCALAGYRDGMSMAYCLADGGVGMLKNQFNRIPKVTGIDLPQEVTEKIGDGSGTWYTGTVHVSPAPTEAMGNYWLSINSSNPSLVIPILAIAGHSGSGPAQIKVLHVNTPTPVTITVSSVNGAPAKKTVTVVPNVPWSIVVNPSTVKGGATATVTVTLNSPAPAGGETFQMKSLWWAVTFSSDTLTIPAGQKSGQVTVMTPSVTEASQVAILAYQGYLYNFDYLNITP
jgi:WD40 repeat protein